MIIRNSLSAGTAFVALTMTASAAFGQQMSYEQSSYEFAEPLPASDPVPVPQIDVPEATVQPVLPAPAPQMPAPVFTSEPIVQPVAKVAEPAAYPAYEEDVEIVSAAPPLPVERAPVAPAHGHHYAQAGEHSYHHSRTAYPAAYRGYAEAPSGPPLPPQPSYDKDAWLDDCEAELRRREGRGEAAGGFLGAVAGGLIGNRVADGERLGGTLLGAGIGGIAGAVIGSAIGSAVRGNPYLRECRAYLENWDRNVYGRAAYGQPHYGYAHAHSQQVTYIHYPIERPVIREYVTEEWVDVPVEAYEYETVIEKRAVRQPVKYTKQRPAKRTKYIKR